MFTKISASSTQDLPRASVQVLMLPSILGFLFLRISDIRLMTGITHFYCQDFRPRMIWFRVDFVSALCSSPLHFSKVSHTNTSILLIEYQGTSNRVASATYYIQHTVNAQVLVEIHQARERLLVTGQLLWWQLATLYHMFLLMICICDAIKNASEAVLCSCQVVISVPSHLSQFSSTSARYQQDRRDHVPDGAPKIQTPGPRFQVPASQSGILLAYFFILFPQFPSFISVRPWRHNQSDRCAGRLRGNGLRHYTRYCKWLMQNAQARGVFFVLPNPMPLRTSWSGSLGFLLSSPVILSCITSLFQILSLR